MTIKNERIIAIFYWNIRLRMEDESFALQNWLLCSDIRLQTNSDRLADNKSALAPATGQIHTLIEDIIAKPGLFSATFIQLVTELQDLVSWIVTSKTALSLIKGNVAQCS